MTTMIALPDSDSSGDTYVSQNADLAFDGTADVTNGVTLADVSITASGTFVYAGDYTFKNVEFEYDKVDLIITGDTTLIGDEGGTEGGWHQSLATVDVSVNPGATLDIAIGQILFDDVTFGGSPNPDSIMVAGTLIGGVGSLTWASVTLASAGVMDADQLVLLGPANVLSGLVKGEGLVLSGSTLLQNAKLQTGTIAIYAGTITVASSLAYHGAWLQGQSTPSTVDIDSGVRLTLTGTEEFDQSGLTGGGTLEIAGSAVISDLATFDAASPLSVAFITVAGSLAIVPDVTCSGAVHVLTDGTITTSAGSALTLNGSLNLDGTLNGNGLVSTTGTVTLHAGTIDGDTTLSIGGTAIQDADLTVGASSGAAAAVDVLGSGIWYVDGSHGVTTPGGSGAIENAGTIVYKGGSSQAQITAELVNSGLFKVASGDILLSGRVVGDGTFQINAGATLDLAGAASSPTAGILLHGTGSEMRLDGEGNFDLGSLRFVGLDEIDLRGFNDLSARPLTLLDGQIIVSDGSNTARISVGGSAKLTQFDQRSDGAGGIALWHI